jgi:hypothetical protein
MDSAGAMIAGGIRDIELKMKCLEAIEVISMHVM